MIDHQYETLLRDVLAHGSKREDRTGTGTCALFGRQLRYDLSEGFPLITTKNVFFKGVVHELLWMLAGDTNVKYLQDNGVHIWDAWADKDGELGPVYGAQWRRWPTPNSKAKYVDQIQTVMDLIKKDPTSRRLVVNAWNVGELSKMALPPCHCLFQFFVADGKLSCQLYQRSADLFLGVPFNIASYSLLTHMVAQQCGLDVGEFVWTGGDCHIYINHVEQASKQISREPYDFPQLVLKKASSIFRYKFSDISLVNYRHWPTIKAPVAV